ncbi:hypothetical protein A3K24_01750 [candidate division Kazan bacterium RIFCSPHIGHO2_01_FULL_44_14]|uniref:Baseplate protein J-like domain-containing protein n=1 Tax=candidate division Kazan bacterium RIFCSPLOWO2_01_FULL_45_19 TaxID=1798538 RepID=A0A1F4NQ25_UNCK3|nr:hypothetical protein [uncultured bacterium]AQS30972.1 hypothetical protein [uncultured bacterium]OGB73554.1 MAG: hypothetical protein A3K51_01750 [candidate division Kazan bacterium RIFCSPLOWO2_01_FULL_45_19]OGB77799.1 MAG: hypothetical protein A3K24_01750 [candidate division Kazan bacterium RIFCSPHIGHO2_01_FULL_44_14]
MADQLIYLELGDDIAEATNRLRRAKQSEITMVIPRRALMLQSTINLKILKTQADLFEKQVSIVTQDEVGRNFAVDAGFKVMDQLKDTKPPKRAETSMSTEPVAVLTEAAVDDENNESDGVGDIPLRQSFARSRRSSQLIRWKLPAMRLPHLTLRQLKWERHHRVTLGFVLVGLVILGSVAVFVAPKAYVALEVQSEVFQKQFTLVLADVQDRRAAGPNILTGRFVEVSRENVSTFNATGEENNGKKATGKITVLNYTTTIQGLLVNTRFQSANGLVFRLNGEVLVPPIRSGSPGRAAVDATADGGGTKYNVTQGTKLTVPGLGEAGKTAVVGEVAGAFTGGTDEITKVVSEEDIEKGKEAAAKDIFAAAETELREQLKRGEELSSSLLQNDIIDAVPSASPGAKRDQFEVRVRSRSWAIAINQGDLTKAVVASAAFEVPEGKQVTKQTVERAEISVVESNFLNHRINLIVKLDGRIGPQLDTDALAVQLANKSLADGQKLLQGMTEITSGSIEMWPTFLTHTPLLPNNIRVQVIYLGE